MQKLRFVQVLMLTELPDLQPARLRPYQDPRPRSRLSAISRWIKQQRRGCLGHLRSRKISIPSDGLWNNQKRRLPERGFPRLRI